MGGGGGGFGKKQKIHKSSDVTDRLMFSVSNVLKFNYVICLPSLIIVLFLEKLKLYSVFCMKYLYEVILCLPQSFFRF